MRVKGFDKFLRKKLPKRLGSFRVPRGPRVRMPVKGLSLRTLITFGERDDWEGKALLWSFRISNRGGAGACRIPALSRLGENSPTVAEIVRFWPGLTFARAPRLLSARPQFRSAPGSRHAFGGGAAHPQDAHVRTKRTKRVGDNALHPQTGLITREFPFNCTSPAEQNSRTRLPTVAWVRAVAATTRSGPALRRRPRFAFRRPGMPPRRRGNRVAG